MANQLKNASSPYLLQHRDNPVHWREWNQEALAESKATGKPILLSIGYAACHWCHVMAHESFENEETAALMNMNFIPIKVDREERPDIDSIYQQALAVLGEQGGWPLTMFLNPDCEPFWGGTYFPPKPSYGRPSFTQVLEQIHDYWTKRKENTRHNAQMIKNHLEEINRARPGHLIELEGILDVVEDFEEHFDLVYGGLGQAPKFPQAPALLFLSEVASLNKDLNLKAKLVYSLRKMCAGGLYDHAGGGFARYCVDQGWLVPHFEKMLYDNALFIRLLARFHSWTGDPVFLKRLDHTVSWLKREMSTPIGLASSLDADSEGEEGRFYVWQAQEIDELLGSDAEEFKSAYGVSKRGNWEGKNILHRLHKMDEPENALLEDACASLLKARNQRVKPGLDDKVLCDWNGMMISALAQAGFSLNRKDYIDFAQEIERAISSHLWNGQTLSHSMRGTKKLNSVFLDDYAHLMDARISLFQATGDQSYIDQALVLWRKAEQELMSKEGALRFKTKEPGDLLVKTDAVDGPAPSGNAQMILNLSRLFWITGDLQYRDAAETILKALAGQASRAPQAHATYYRAALFYHHALVAKTGPLTPGEQSTLNSELGLDGLHLLDEAQRDYQWCTGASCSLPLNEFENFITSKPRLN